MSECDEKLELVELVARYHSLCHAMQTGVGYRMERDKKEVSPKHLRVGINSAMTEHGALVKLLLDKGLITEVEYYRALVSQFEIEVKSYEDWLSNNLGVGETKVHLA